MKGEGLLILISFIVTSIILITIIHEMGHAMVALLFSKKKVKVFFGSHGDTENSFHYKIGRCCLYIRKNIYKWKGGLCISQGDMNFYQNALFILAGTIFPFAIGLILYVTTKDSLNDYMYGFSFIFLSLSIISLIRNLYPERKAVVKKNGILNPNDGYLLIRLFVYKKIYNEYVHAINLYNEQRFTEATEAFTELIEKGATANETISLIISSSLMSKDYNLTKNIIEKYIDSIEPNINNYINIGYYYTLADQHEKALEYYFKALNINENWHALNNIGYTFITNDNYNGAIIYLNRAIDIEAHAYSYNNRGLAKIKTGEINDGLKDLAHGHTLDPNNSYYYKNMGIYHFDIKEYQKALEFFEKAKEIDPSTYKIDDDIEKTKSIQRKTVH